MSTPIARPFGPTFFAARKTSNPAPLPRSITVSPCSHYMLVVRLRILRNDKACLAETGYHKRIAAAKAKIGVARDAVELLFGVAECLGYGAGM